MFSPVYHALTSARGGAFAPSASDCLARLLERVDGEADRILTITVFGAAAGRRDYERKKAAFDRALEKAGARIPWSLAAQPPIRPYRAGLYAETLPAGDRAIVRRKRAGGFLYAVVESGRDRFVYAAGLTGSAGADFPASGRAALGAAGRILAREGLPAGRIVRQWNYLPGILDARGPQGQNYQCFNERRREFYSRFDFPQGYPAATGIGTRGGGVVVDFRALAPRTGLRIIPLSNPLQTDAHRYSMAVLAGSPAGPDEPRSAPLFERAKFAGDARSGQVYVSGTAAVRGQKTEAVGDVAAQTGLTIENIRRLVSPAHLRRHGLAVRPAPAAFSYVRAYVRRAADLALVRRLVRAACGEVPAHFVQADICRRDLLVEIEGILELTFEPQRETP